MAQTSGFFNAIVEGGNPDRAYDAEDFAKYFAAFLGNGIFANNKNNLKVVTNDNNLSVKVRSGRAFVNGYWFDSDSDVALTIARNDVIPSMSPRWDAVVLSFDFALRTARLEVKTGISASSYSAGKQNVYKSLSRNLSGVYQLCLAIVRVPPNVITYQVESTDIYDVRAEKYCGWVTGLVKQLDVSSVVEQLQIEFDKWFAHMQDQLTDDAAGNLQYQIDLLNHLVSAQTPVVLYDERESIGSTHKHPEESDYIYLQLAQSVLNFDEIELFYSDYYVYNNSILAQHSVKVRIPQNADELANVSIVLQEFKNNEFASDGIDFFSPKYSFVQSYYPWGEDSVKVDRLYTNESLSALSVYKAPNADEDDEDNPNAHIKSGINMGLFIGRVDRIVGYGNRNLLPIPGRDYSEVMTESYKDNAKEVTV